MAINGTKIETKIDALLRAGFPSPLPAVVELVEVGSDRGVFSTVVQLQLDWPNDHAGPSTKERPKSVVAKLPLDGANGKAAGDSGAYRREALAYQELLDRSPVAHPAVYSVVEFQPGHVGFLLEDLTALRSVDQLVGLGERDAVATATALRTFHQHWTNRGQLLSRLDVRRDILAALPVPALNNGLHLLERDWSGYCDDRQQSAFRAIVAAAPVLAERLREFGNVTLCHGDCRADNIVFDRHGQPVLFDWQQIVAHTGEFDLAWLSGTSLAVETRRSCERRLIEAYGGDFDHYRYGFVLPGLLVLMLIQRELPTPRLQLLAATSLNRIGQALVDLEIDGLVR